MKKAFVVFIITLFFVSCSKGLENKAVKQMKETLNELAKNPESLKLSKKKTIYNNDSICVLQFIAKGQNGFGGYNSSHYEYILVRIRDGKDPNKITYNECLIDLDENDPITGEHNKSIMDIDKKTLNDFRLLSKKEHQKIKEEDLFPTCLYYGALVVTIAEGREIKDMK